MRGVSTSAPPLLAPVRRARLTPYPQSNRRFAVYCPYCQTTVGPSALPQGLRDPPPYTPLPTSTARPPPPPYYETPISTSRPPSSGQAPDEKSPLQKGSNEKKEDEQDIPEDTLHFVDPNNDTVSSLSLRYGVPVQALRSANRLGSDHLLAARRTVVIPGAFYKGGVSLSPQPVEVGYISDREYWRGRAANRRPFLSL